MFNVLCVFFVTCSFLVVLLVFDMWGSVFSTKPAKNKSDMTYFGT